MPYTNPMPPRDPQGYSEPEYTTPGSGLPRRLPAPQAPPNPNYQVKGVQPGKEYVASGGNVFIAEYVRALPHWIDDLTRDVGSDIYERMLLDYQCFSCLRSIILQALADGVELHPAIRSKDDPDYEVSKLWLTFGQYILDNLPVTLELWLREMLLGAALGHRLAEQTYIPCEDGKVVDLPIFAARNRREPWMIGALKTKPRRCYSWVQDVYANTVGVIGLVPGQTAPVFTGSLITAVGELPNVIPRSKFVAFNHDPWYGDPRGTSLFRSAYRPWWEKIQVSGEYLKCLSRFGSPSLIGTTAEGAVAEAPTDGNGNVTGAVLSPEQKMLNMLTQFFNGSVCAVPFGSSVQVVWPGAGAGEAFASRIKLADDQIAKAITMQTLASEQATHQARAAAEVHQETGEPGPKYFKILVVDMLYRDLLVPLVRANGGPDAVRLCPRPTLSPIPASDRWTAVAAAAGAGYHLDDSQLPALDEQLGMPPRESQETPPEDEQDQQQQEGQQQGQEGEQDTGAGFARVGVSLPAGLDLGGMDRRGAAGLMLAGLAGSSMSPMEEAALFARHHPDQSFLWDAAKHPRDEKGEFTGKSDGEAEFHPRPVTFREAGRTIHARFRKDGKTHVEEQGSKRVVTYTHNGIKSGYVTDADGRNVRGFVVRERQGDPEPQAEPEPVSRAEQMQQEAMAKAASDHQRAKLERRQQFQQNVGHRILSAAKVASDLSKSGFPIYRRTAREKRPGYDVGQVPGKKTWLMIEWQNAGVADHDSTAKTDELKAHLEKEGYTVSRPYPDPTILAVRKPLTQE